MTSSRRSSLFGSLFWFLFVSSQCWHGLIGGFLDAAVRRLAPDRGRSGPDQGAIPLDYKTATNLGVIDADFVSYGSYGELQIWSTTTLEAKPCLAMVAEDRIIMVRCSAPSLDPVADLDFRPTCSHPRRPVSRSHRGGTPRRPNGGS
ncbi:hypothetical protein [Cellulomonas sp. Leaf395]|uniref:hypothetical protein n=1 Tax=Cellulomonas sp. Leaf395 TaxID=1736362 RepID=UPI0012FA6B2A|nr:hypothetical protein [Cellulomonas sp. Leaf395]